MPNRLLFSFMTALVLDILYVAGFAQDQSGDPNALVGHTDPVYSVDFTPDGAQIVTGSFDSAYTMTVTSQSEAAPNYNMTMTMAAKWLGPCAADQKPGDMIMGNGLKMNILEMQKRGLSQGVPLPR